MLVIFLNIIQRLIFFRLIYFVLFIFSIWFLFYIWYTYLFILNAHFAKLIIKLIIQINLFIALITLFSLSLKYFFFLINLLRLGLLISSLRYHIFRHFILIFISWFNSNFFSPGPIFSLGWFNYLLIITKITLILISQIKIISLLLTIILTLFLFLRITFLIKIIRNQIYLRMLFFCFYLLLKLVFLS